MNYLNQGYYNPYLQQAMVQAPPPQQAPPMMTQPQPQPLGMINGKIVDSIDVVKATEVPMGSYAIFPKADLSEIYVKSWNNNGTTTTIPFIPNPASPKTVTSLTIEQVMEKLSILESKIDTLSAGAAIQPAPPAPVPAKEARSSDY